jgi:hypothetical protein
MSSHHGLLLYDCPGHEPVWVKIISNQTGCYVFERHRLVVGKAIDGFTSRITRDLRYHGIDGWNRKFGFELLEFFRVEPDQPDGGTFRLEEYSPIDFTDLEQQHRLYWRAQILKDTRRDLGKQIRMIHQSYGASECGRIESGYMKLDSLFMARGFLQKTPDGFYIQEVKRQVLFDLKNSVLVAWEHASAMALAQKLARKDVVEAVRYRENILLSEAFGIAETVQMWDGVVELFDTPPPIFQFFEDNTVKPWEKLSIGEKENFLLCLREARPNAIIKGQKLDGAGKCDSMPSKAACAFTFRFTREEHYRRRIRAVLRAENTVTMQDMGEDTLLPHFVSISEDWREIIEATTRSGDKELRKQDIQLSLLFLNSVVLQNLIIPNVGVDFRRQLLIDSTGLEWVTSSGEALDLTLVMCSYAGRILCASKEEIPFVATDEYLVDRILFRVEKANYNQWRRPRKGTGWAP